MRFLVVVCPACRRAQALESRFERVACVSCRSPLKVRELKVFFRGDRESETREAVMRVGAQLHGMDANEFAKVMASLVPEPTATIEDVLGAFENHREFDSTEFAETMGRLGASGDPRRILEGLRADNRIFEPREGRYRVV